MIYTIYLVFVDAAAFIWKYPYIIITSYLYLLASWLLATISIGDSIPEICLRSFLPLTLSLLNIVFVSTVIYYNEIVSDKKPLFRKIFVNATERALILSVELLLVVFFYGFLESLLSLIFNVSLLEIMSNIIYLLIAIAYFFGIMVQVFYQTNSLFVPVVEGLNGFFKNIVFYFFVYLMSLLIIRFPSLLFPASWIAIPIIPLAEGVGIRQTGWSGAFWFLLCPILSTLQLVAVNFAFLYKNRIKLPAILNPKSEIVN